MKPRSQLSPEEQDYLFNPENEERKVDDVTFALMGRPTFAGCGKNFEKYFAAVHKWRRENHITLDHRGREVLPP